MQSPCVRSYVENRCCCVWASSYSRIQIPPTPCGCQRGEEGEKGEICPAPFSQKASLRNLGCGCLTVWLFTPSSPPAVLLPQLPGKALVLQLCAACQPEGPPGNGLCADAERCYQRAWTLTRAADLGVPKQSLDLFIQLLFLFWTDCETGSDPFSTLVRKSTALLERKRDLCCSSAIIMTSWSPENLRLLSPSVLEMLRMEMEPQFLRQLRGHCLGCPGRLARLWNHEPLMDKRSPVFVLVWWEGKMVGTHTCGWKVLWHLKTLRKLSKSVTKGVVESSGSLT